MNRILVGAVAVMASAPTGQAAGLDEYGCSFCVSSVEHAVSRGEKFISACENIFPVDVCEWTFEDRAFANTNGSGIRLREGGARQICVEHGRCESLEEESWRSKTQETASPSFAMLVKGKKQSSLDIRVSKAYGSRGYDKVRVSVVSDAPFQSDVFSYSEPFQHRWTQYYLNTGIVSVAPGAATSVKIGDESFDITIPSQGEGVRGIVIGDPCFTSEFITCVYKRPFDMFNRSTSIMNAIFQHDDVHFWNILGDNFYDQTGDNTGSWFGALTKETKSAVLGSIPGNHDFWINASPKLWTTKDQLGNGFMQYYGQDVAAALGGDAPYDFSSDPDAPDTSAENLPPPSNFFYYNQVGNVGFIGYSGAHQYDDMVPYFEEACKWAADTEGIQVLLLEGHWNSDGDGCDADMTVPEVYSSIAALPACQPVASKMRYLLGHKHCNEIIDKDVGFMFGGWGMSDYQCGGSFGLPIIDTTGGTFRVLYLPLQQAWPQTEIYDRFDEVLACIQKNGISGCYEYATEWSNVPILG